MFRGILLFSLFVFGILPSNLYARPIRQAYRLVLKFKRSPLIQTLSEHRDLVFEATAEGILSGAQGYLATECFSRAKKDNDSFFNAAGIVLLVNAIRGLRKGLNFLKEITKHYKNRYDIRQKKRDRTIQSSPANIDTSNIQGGAGDAISQ